MNNELARSWKDPESADHDVQNPVAGIEVGGLAPGPDVRATTEYFITLGCCTYEWDTCF